MQANLRPHLSLKISVMSSNPRGKVLRQSPDVVITVAVVRVRASNPGGEGWAVVKVLPGDHALVVAPQGEAEGVVTEVVLIGLFSEFGSGWSVLVFILKLVEAYDGGLCFLFFCLHRYNLDINRINS